MLDLKLKVWKIILKNGLGLCLIDQTIILPTKKLLDKTLAIIGMIIIANAGQLKQFGSYIMI
jgi:hypothetical protein